MKDKKIIRQELIDKFKGTDIIHPNPLTSGELKMLDICLESLPDEPMEYLNECIKKATPNLSKIKDVDKELAEIRGEQSITDEIKKYDKMLLYTFSVHEKEDEDRKDRSYYSLKALDEKSAREKLIEITDEQIDDILFLNVSIPFEVPEFNCPDFRALSLKAQLINLRDELIKYDKWMSVNHFGEELPTAEKAIDKYLNSIQ